MSHRLRGTLVAAAAALFTAAHVGSPDTVFEGAAGPYAVRVIVRAPGVVPGQAEITVRLLGDTTIRSILVLPLRGGRPTALEPPPDTARAVAGDPRVYTAQLWLMEAGAYSVRVTVTGTAGSGSVDVPVNAVATRRLGLATPLALGLAGLGLFLLIGALTIVGAAVRESVLPPGVEPEPARVRRAWWVRVATVPLLALVLYGGKRWWDGEDAVHARSLYRPLQVSATITSASDGPRLRLAITDSEWIGRWYSPLIPDHGKLMHLFLVRVDLAAFAHLHPVMRDSSDFTVALPPLPAGRYRLYADVVHETGFAQTLLDSLTLPAPGRVAPPGDADDSWWAGRVTPGRHVVLADGSVMTWLDDAAPPVAGRDFELRFVVARPDGRPARLEPYMGMASHAVFLRDDGSVFVHLHPTGTAAMASQLAYTLRQSGDTVRGRLGERITAVERMSAGMGGRLSSDTVSIPYAFPRAGRYRLFVQVRRGGRVLTGAFDAAVPPAP
jgi:hypothetical protein